MSFHKGPEICAPPDKRCEATAKGKKPFEWALKPHRCTKFAQASRAGFAVCWVHNRTKIVEKWEGGPDEFPALNRYGRTRQWKPTNTEQG